MWRCPPHISGIKGEGAITVVHMPWPAAGYSRTPNSGANFGGRLWNASDPGPRARGQLAEHSDFGSSRGVVHSATAATRRVGDSDVPNHAYENRAL